SRAGTARAGFLSGARFAAVHLRGRAGAVSVTEPYGGWHRYLSRYEVRVSDTGTGANPPLSRRLEEDDAGGDRDVEALDVPGHRDRDEHIARLPDEPPEPGPLAAEHDRGRQRPVVLVVGHGGVRGEPDRPDVQRLQLLDRPRDVDDVGHGH